jgi:dienelactone hydrolase
MVVLAAVGASATACSSSSTSSSADSGTDAHTSGMDAHTSNADAGKDAAKDVKTTSDTGADTGHQGHDAATDSPATSEGGTGSPTAHFVLPAMGAPNLMDVPFPTDLYLTAAGTIVDPIPGATNVITNNPTFITHEFGKLNGFSRVAQALFWVDDPAGAAGVATIDPSSLPVNEAACVADGSSVFVLDLSATGAAARIPCRAAFHDDRALGTSGYRPVVAVGPGRGVVLQEGHQYATVITSRVKTTSGKNIGASADFTALSGPTTQSSVYSSALTKVKGILGSALGTDTVVDLAVFTTNSETKVLLQMRTDLESLPLPTLAWDATSMAPMGAVKFAAPVNNVVPAGFTSLDAYLGVFTGPTLGDGGPEDPNSDLKVRAHDKLAAIGTAVFQAENYLSPSMGYSVLDGATFTVDANGKVIPNAAKPTAPIWITFFIPSSPMPANGYPVVIVQHGLGESRAVEPFNLANTFAAAGWAVAAIDSVTFGARASEAEYQVDKVNNFASSGGTYSGPDGLADAIGNPPATNGLDDMFGTLQDLGAIRDQFRQAEIDTSQLARILHSSPVLTPLQTGATPPKIDGTKIAYVGNSLGGIEGAAAAAIEPYIGNWVLNVAGGGILLELADHSPRVAADLAFAGLNFGSSTDRLTESHPLINFIQTVIDPGDSINFAPYVVLSPATVNGAPLAPKNVLQISTVYDDFVPNEANEALARALGIHLATPNVGTNSGVSTMAMVKDPTMIPDRLPLPDQDPDDAGLIHDTPVKGTTAVLVQTIPGIHGGNFQQGLAPHSFAIPYNQFDSGTPFVPLGKGSASADPPFSITCSYLQLQAMAVRFLSDGFAGKTPNVTGIPAPVRDYDGDGFDDSVDSDPNNPMVH